MACYSIVVVLSMNVGFHPKEDTILLGRCQDVFLLVLEDKDGRCDEKHIISFRVMSLLLCCNKICLKGSGQCALRC